MEKELDPEVIKTTQLTLGKYVKRPPLSEKLLKKPPFRFLHDIITTVLKTTGFFQNLFEEEELISDNVKDRDSKISFLTKVIFVISATTGKPLSIKPSKIVAGQEVEKTNELLQYLAQALDDKLSSDKAVQQYKDGIKSENGNQTQKMEIKSKESGKPTKKGNDTKKLVSRSSEKLSNQKNDVIRKNDKEKTNDVKLKRKENGTTKSEVQPKKTQQSKTVAKKNIKEQQKDDNAQTRTHVLNSNISNNEKSSNITEKEKIPKQLSKLDGHGHDVDMSVEKENLDDEKLNDIEIDSLSLSKQEDQGLLDRSCTTIVNDLNVSASSTDVMETAHFNTSEHKSTENHIREISLTDMGQQNHVNIDVNERVTLKSLELDVNIPDKSKHTALASTANNRETEIQTKMVESNKLLLDNSTTDTKEPRPLTVRPLSVRPSSSRPGAPRMRDKVDNVLKDTDNLLMGKVNIIVENTQNEEEEDASLIIMDQSETTVVSKDQQELQLSSSEHGHLVQQILESQKELSQISGKTEIEWQFGAQKAREAVNQDVEQLRFNIQALSRVSNPLGKLLDHVQEDAEVMRQELQQWTNIYEDVNKDMMKQKILNEDTLTPFYTKLKQLESDIEEKHDKINDLKILIHKNAIRIEKLLTSGNVQ